MDNLCHTLVGLAIGQAGLKRRSPLGNATLMIAANIPDVDGLSMFGGRTAMFQFRRGWTHGILAIPLWPFVLTGFMIAFDRLVRRRLWPDAPPVNPKGLLLLSALAVITHPLLDLMNTYGVRLLMPFDARWFYADTLFIVDPWLLILLLAGILLTSSLERRARPAPERPARLALAVCLLYIAAMATLGLMSRGEARRTMQARGLDPVRLMAGPVPIDPFKRDVVAEVSGGYVTATLDWRESGERRLMIDPRLIERFDTLPMVRAAAADPDGAAFLRWARFPFAAIGPANDCPGDVVCFRDLRYGRQPWAQVPIRVGGRLSSPATPR